MGKKHRVAAEHLPEVLARIRDELGDEAMLKFAAAFGGERVHIPNKVRPESRVARGVGQELGQRIADLFGGGAEITVPLGPTAGDSQIRKAISKLLHEGHSTNEIVRQLRCHEVTVRRVRSELRGKGTR